MLHGLAIDHMNMEEETFALKVPMDRWSDIGAMLWKERREILFLIRIRGKTKPEKTGNTMAELNSPITEIINKAKTMIIKPKFINKRNSKIGNIRGHAMCFKCRARYVYSEL